MEKPWITHPLILRGATVHLVPLEKEHLDELYLAASDKNLWRHIPTDCSEKESFLKAYNQTLAERESGGEYPFVILHKSTGKMIGSTRFFEIFPEHRKLEIGWTWIVRQFWGSAVNFECKLLLLTYCFETLHTVRVQFKTKDTNLRSRKAIEKLGAKFEGILRKDKIQADGTTRNAAYFSLLDEEWPDAKQKIQAQLAARRIAADNAPLL